MAANSIQPVNFFAGMQPEQYQQQAALAQQQAMAQKLMEEGSTPLNPIRMAGRFNVPISGMEAAAHGGKMLAAAMMQRNANEEQAKLSQQQMMGMMNLLKYGTLTAPGNTQVASAAPASDVPQSIVKTGAQPAWMPQQQASVNPSPQAPAAQGKNPFSATGDPNKDIGLLMAGNIFGPSYAALMAKQYEPTDLAKNIEGAGYAPGSPEARAAYSHTLNPPMNVRPGGTVFQPGPGGGAQYIAPNLPQGSMPIQPNQPQAGVQAIPGAADVSALNAGAGGHLTNIKTSSGQDIQLTPTELLQWQRTQQLPARYGQQQTTPVAPAPQQALPSGVPPQDATAYNAVRDASLSGGNARAFGNGPNALSGGALPPQQHGIGTPGMSQSQPQQIEQERQRAAGKAVDEQFAKDYVQFSTGGAADAAKQLAQLNDVVGALNGPKPNLTGPMLGHVPDAVKAFTNPKSIAMRERVEEVVQRSLRAILGAQFTEKEGERLIARAYNPTLGEKENAVRVQRLMTQLQQGFASKQDAAKYFEKNGTLMGWQGKLPSMADFDPEPQRQSGAVKLTPAEDAELKALRARFGR